MAPFHDDSPWGSHLPALLGCVAETTGGVLEIGVGYYSTPALHAVCCPKRELISVEANQDWVRQFADFNCQGHLIIHDPDYSSSLERLARRRWAVLFIDHSPGERRALDFKLFLTFPPTYAVIHDYSWEGIREPMQPLLALFPHAKEFTRYPPSTLVLGYLPIPESIL